MPPAEIYTLNRLNDVLVKYIFFDEKRKPLTLSLINAFFEAEGTQTIVDFTFVDREPDPDKPKGKQPRLDVLGVCKDGTVVEIEFQDEEYLAMPERVTFYWARLAQRRTRGTPYGKLPRVVCISILGYEHFPDFPEYHSCYMIFNTKHPECRLTHLLELHFAEIPKWEKQRPRTAEMDQLSRWMAYFSPKTTRQQLEELAMQDAMIREALNAQKVFESNTELMSAYDWAEKDRLDRLAHQAFWEDKVKRGVEEGQAETLHFVAKNMLKLNLPVDQIAQSTGLSISEIESLSATLEKQ